MTIRAVTPQHRTRSSAFQAHRDEEVEFLWTLPGKVVPLLTRHQGAHAPDADRRRHRRAPGGAARISRHGAEGLSKPRGDGVALFACGGRPDPFASVLAAALAGRRREARGVGRATCTRPSSRWAERSAANTATECRDRPFCGPSTANCTASSTDQGNLRSAKPAQSGQDRRSQRGDSARPHPAAWPPARPKRRAASTPLERRDAAQEVGGLQRLRHVQDAVARVADVPLLPRRKPRRGESARQGQRAARLLTGRLDPSEWTAETMKRAERPVLQLQAVPARVSVERQHSADDDRGQGRAGRRPRHEPGRLDPLAGPFVRLAGKHGVAGDELGDRQRGGALVPGEAGRHFPPPEAAPLRPAIVHEFRPPRSRQRRGKIVAAAARSSTSSATTSIGTIRSWGGRFWRCSTHNGISRARAAGPNVIGNGDDFRRRSGSGPGRRRAERPRAGRTGPRGMSDRLHRTFVRLCLKYEYPMILNHPDVDVVASQVVDAGAYLRRSAPRGPAQDRFSAARPGRRLPYAVPSQGAAMRHAAGRSALFDSRNCGSIESRKGAREWRALTA